MSGKSCVYWIHLPEQTDIFTQGYVGVSAKGKDHRYREHKSKARQGSKLPIHSAIRKYGDKLVIETVVLADLKYCYEVEEKLRPTSRIGYNVDAGGNCNRLGTKLSEETKEKMRKAALVSGNKPSREAIENSAKTNSQKVGWLCKFANKEVWKLAGQIYEYLLLNPSHGTRKTAGVFGTTPDQLSTMFRKFKSGWNPWKDSQWLVFSGNACHP